ncbi:hypothetical protein [Pedobacter panaciterrae]|uniref:hypothetical protein n=1 Tax=Pedobacter panaciterrae TaxID=363849 RepID=UPI002591E509|nr:hypothetical protein [uncultured Pedobacter sp.]
MLESITWKEFAIVIAAAALAWYAFVGLIYFRDEIKGLAKGKNVPQDTAEELINESHPESATDDTDSVFAELEMVVLEIRHGILEKAGGAAGKEALFTQLQQRLAGYQGLGKPAFRSALNNFIITNSKEICGVAFSEEELNAAWDRLPR